MYASTDMSIMSADELTPFKHAPLTNPGSSIRLLRHIPGSELNFELSEFSLPSHSGRGSSPREKVEPPSYWALSYTWGDATPTHAVNVNGQSYEVRQNLYDLLRTVSMGGWPNVEEEFETEIGTPFHQSYFWVDQICIDQGNHEEKSIQVHRMKYVYRRASSTIAWLGKASEDLQSTLITPGMMQAYEVAHLSAKDAHNLMLLSERPYWSRMWVIQEIILSRNLFVMSGNDGIPWSQYSWLLHSVSNNHEHAVFFRHASDITILNHPPEQMRLSWAIQLFGHYECHDLRDKVFALMGLVKTEARARIDYNFSCHQLFFEVMDKVQQHEQYGTDFRNTAQWLMEMLNLEEDDDVNRYVNCLPYGRRFSPGHN